MSHPKFKAILFDLDGTLLHTAPDLTIAVNNLRAEQGLCGVYTVEAFG